MQCCAKPQSSKRPAEARFSLSGRSTEVAQTDLRVTELIDDKDVKAASDARGWSNNIPVVIVPGFCSSGLMVVRSDEIPEWKNERVRGKSSCVCCRHGCRVVPSL
jgi:hypothetical protein